MVLDRPLRVTTLRTGGGRGGCGAGGGGGALFCPAMVKRSNSLPPDLDKNEENQQPLALVAQCCERYHLLITRHALHLFIFIVTFQTLISVI